MTNRNDSLKVDPNSLGSYEKDLKEYAEERIRNLKEELFLRVQGKKNRVEKIQPHF